MTPDEFYRGLEALGFTDCGVRSPGTPELRSYDPPVRLRAVLSSVNIGRTVLDSGVHYAVTLQASDGCERRIIEGEPKEIKPELGSAFGPILFPMEQALLDALALDADQLLEWIDHYPIFSFRMAPVDRPGDKIAGVGTRRGLEPAEDMNWSLSGHPKRCRLLPDITEASARSLPPLPSLRRQQSQKHIRDHQWLVLPCTSRQCV